MVWWAYASLAVTVCVWAVAVCVCVYVSVRVSLLCSDSVLSDAYRTQSRLLFGGG